MSYLSIATVVALGLVSTVSHSQVETHLVAPGTYRIEVDLAEIAVRGQEDIYQDIYAEGFDHRLGRGDPEVLTTGRLFIVPAGHRLEVRVVDSDVRTISDVNLRPKQRRYRCEHPDNGRFHVNERIYFGRAAESFFPESIYDIEFVGYMGSARLVRLAIHPVRWRAIDETLQVYSRLLLEARVSLIDAKRASEWRQRGQRTLGNALNQVVRSVAVNGSEWPEFGGAYSTQESMLVIAANSLVAEMGPFLEWKTQRGIRVKLMSYAEAGGSRTALRRTIQDYYDELGGELDYVLLVGNHNGVATYKQRTSSGYAASDYPYTLLSGRDSLPDVLIGRFVVGSSDQLRIVMNKAIQYERGSNAETDWIVAGTTIASREGRNPTDQGYAQRVQNSLKERSYLEVDAFYERYRTATASNIIEALNEGRSWLTYFGHGSGQSWGSTNTRFSTTTIGGLQNVSKLPVIVDVACLNGAYDRYSKSFGEAWVWQTHRGEPAGAVAYYGASVSTSWHTPAIMATGAAEYHFQRSTHSVGATMLAGQSYLIERHGLRSYVIDNLEWFNLFGDPSMLMKTDRPTRLDVQLEQTPSAIEISIVDDAGQGVTGIPITLSNGTDILAVETTTAAGSATVNTSGRDLSGAKVTVSGYNVETVIEAL